jgi:hypothetical protein
MAADEGGSRRLVGVAMAASALLIGLAAALIHGQVIPVEEGSRALIAGVLGLTAALDGLVAVYFLVSDAS